MEGNYCIAYIDKNGNGFLSFEPWIIEYSDDLTECKVEASELLKDGNQDITIFSFMILIKKRWIALHVVT